MVLNTSYGDRESLPFDLRHKAGPIIFNLGADAKKEVTTRVQRGLTQSLKTALRECLRQVEDRPSATHTEIPRGFSVAQYFEDSEVLAERENMGGLQCSCVTMSARCYIYASFPRGSCFGSAILK